MERTSTLSVSGQSTVASSPQDDTGPSLLNINQDYVMYLGESMVVFVQNVFVKPELNVET